MVRKSEVKRKSSGSFESEGIKLKEAELTEKQEALQKLAFFYTDSLAILKALEVEIADNLKIFGLLEKQAQEFALLSGSKDVSRYSEVMKERVESVSAVYGKSAEALERLLKEVKRGGFLCENAHRDVLEALTTVELFIQNKEETITKIFEGFVR